MTFYFPKVCNLPKDSSHDNAQVHLLGRLPHTQLVVLGKGLPVPLPPAKTIIKASFIPVYQCGIY